MNDNKIKDITEDKLLEDFDKINSELRRLMAEYLGEFYFGQPCPETNNPQYIVEPVFSYEIHASG